MKDIIIIKKYIYFSNKKFVMTSLPQYLFFVKMPNKSDDRHI